MASDTDSADVTELTERNEDSGLSGVDKRKEIDVLLIQIKSRKRTAKTKVTKLRHELERLCVKDSEVMVIESVIEQLWTALGKCTGDFRRTFCVLCRDWRRIWQKRNF